MCMPTPGRGWEMLTMKKALPRQFGSWRWRIQECFILLLVLNELCYMLSRHELAECVVSATMGILLSVPSQRLFL